METFPNLPAAVLEMPTGGKLMLLRGVYNLTNRSVNHVPSSFPPKFTILDALPVFILACLLVNPWDRGPMGPDIVIWAWRIGQAEARYGAVADGGWSHGHDIHFPLTLAVRVGSLGVRETFSGPRQLREQQRTLPR